MSKPASLYDAWSQIFDRQLRECRAVYGHAATGVVIEAALGVIRADVARHQGPEATFDLLTRHADAALQPALDARLRTPEGS